MRQTAWVHCGDALELLRRLEDDSVDAVVTDPPSGISFMGKAWDSDKGGRDAWIAWLAEIMREALRVTKPGGHALVWALPRTQHWTATAVEDAGWQVRDVLMHVFGSGFPKSLNLPDGWGTALKPSHEAWILARKPLAGTVAATVLEHGTGALNIDGCRVGTDGGGTDCPHWPEPCRGHKSAGGAYDSNHGKPPPGWPNNKTGRWPPHLLLSHAAACGETCADGCPVAEMDAQSGVTRGSGAPTVGGAPRSNHGFALSYSSRDRSKAVMSFGDTGGASRFFPVFRYVAKPSTAEKSAGLGGRNTHATVKPLQLMRWLCRLITPPGGLVLDPFAGSGTTGAAAMAEGFSFVGAEMRPEQAAAARQRIQHALVGLEVEQSGEETPEPAAKAGQLGLW